MSTHNWQKWIPRRWVSSNKNKIRKISCLIIVFLIIPLYTVFTYLPVSSSIEEINRTPQPRTIQIPIVLFLSGYTGFAPEADITITLNITYPYGTLIVDEPVKIDAIALLHEPIAIESIKRVSLGFQNSLLVNSTDSEVIHNSMGEPLQGGLNFLDWTADTVSYTDSNGNMYTSDVIIAYDSITLSWSIDGDYKPIIQWFYRSGNPYSGNTSSTVAIYNEVVIHVYPKEQLTQIETNRVNTLLTTSLFFISVAGLFLIAKEVYPKESTPTIIIQTTISDESKLNPEQNPKEAKPPQSPESQIQGKKGKQRYRHKRQ